MSFIRDILFDITWCANEECPHSDACKRSNKHLRTLNPGDRWLSFSSFEPDKDGKCEHYLE